MKGFKESLKTIILVPICFIILLGINYDSHAQVARKIELTEFVREIQIWNKEGNNMSLSFWLPESYWRYALADTPGVTIEVANQILMTFEDYVFICAVDLNINTDGSILFSDQFQVGESISIEDQLGNKYLPLSDTEISNDALAMSEMLKPMFAQMLGQMGQGMHFFFFKVKDENGKNIINELEEGRFIVRHSNKEFKYELPLVVLLPPKNCPVDSLEMKGNWSYCPFHGDKL